MVRVSGVSERCKAYYGGQHMDHRIIISSYIHTRHSSGNLYLDVSQCDTWFCLVVDILSYMYT